MKLLLFVILFLSQFQALANMANPVRSGTLGSSPFVSEYVDVVHEDIFIKIDPTFNFAEYKVVYHIRSSKSGEQIPFLFYASEFHDSFSVYVDGQEVITQDIPIELGSPLGTKFKDFSYFFEGNDQQSEGVLMEETENSGFYVDINNMIYFESPISAGDHSIEVKYKASKWVDGWGEINKYSFRYALSPAKYWKSFGSLHIEVDASEFDHPIQVNFGEPISGEINQLANWQFDSLPAEVIQIQFLPKMSRAAQFFKDLGPFALALIAGIIMAIIHWMLNVRHRRRYKVKKYSWVVILGSLIVPFLFLISWIYFHDFIRYLIGEHASHIYGYAFLVIVLYPLIFPVYWVVFWLLDRRLKVTILDRRA